MRNIMKILVKFILIFCVSHVNAANIKGIEQTISDSMITTLITAKYTKSSNLNPLKIHVKTKKGIVYLSGHVKDNKSFVEALRFAKNTTGAKAVNTRDLEIQPTNTAITDAYITTKAEAAVLSAKILDDESIPLVGIKVSTNNGVVTLSGYVSSNQSIIAITKRVSAVRGVKKVISKLKIGNRAP